MKRIYIFLALMLAVSLPAGAQQFEAGQWNYAAGLSPVPQPLRYYFNDSSASNLYSLSSLYSPYYRDVASSMPVFAEATWHLNRRNGFGALAEYTRCIGTAIDPLTEKEVGEKSLNSFLLTAYYKRVWWQWSWGAFMSKIGFGVAFLCGRNPGKDFWSEFQPVFEVVPYSFVFGNRVFFSIDYVMNTTYLIGGTEGMPLMRMGLGYKF